MARMKIEFVAEDYKRQYPLFAGIDDERLGFMFYSFVLTIGQPVIGLFTGKKVATNWAYLVLSHLLYLEEQGKTGITEKAVQGTESVAFTNDKTPNMLFWGLSPYGMLIAQMIRTRLRGINLIPNGRGSYQGNVMGKVWGSLSYGG